MTDDNKWILALVVGLVLGWWANEHDFMGLGGKRHFHVLPWILRENDTGKQ